MAPVVRLNRSPMVVDWAITLRVEMAIARDRPLLKIRVSRLDYSLHSEAQSMRGGYFMPARNGIH